MEDLILNALTDYGPLAVFVLLMLSGIGIPLGEDIILVPAGIIIAHGRMDLWLTMVFAYSGVLAADCLWYGVCYRYGTPLLHKRWFKRAAHPRRLLEAKHQIERRGAWVIVMARFIPGSRTPAITMAGTLHMRFLKFVLAEAICIAFTVPLQLGIGYLIGRNLGGKGLPDLIFGLLAAVAFVVVVLWALNIWRKHRRGGERPPRAKAVWLRRFRVPRLRAKSRKTG
ncbi:MAG: DedA family protein [Phycisphaerales bacterium]|nr:DedA family protein [Phycisphaerales bacterium]